MLEKTKGLFSPLAAALIVLWPRLEFVTLCWPGFSEEWLGDSFHSWCIFRLHESLKVKYLGTEMPGWAVPGAHRALCHLSLWVSELSNPGAASAAPLLSLAMCSSEPPWSKFSFLYSKDVDKFVFHPTSLWYIKPTASIVARSCRAAAPTVWKKVLLTCFTQDVPSIIFFLPERCLLCQISTPNHGSWWVCREGEGAEWLVPGMAELYPHIPHPFPPPQPPPLQGSEPLPLTRGFAHMKLCNYTGNLIPKGMRERGWAGKDCQVYYLGVCWLGWFFCFSFCCRWQSTCKSLPCVHYWGFMA